MNNNILPNCNLLPLTFDMEGQNQAPYTYTWDRATEHDVRLDDSGQPRPESLFSWTRSPQARPHIAHVHHRVGKTLWMRPRSARGLSIPVLTSASGSGSSVVKVLGHWSESQAPATPSCPTVEQNPWCFLLHGHWVMADLAFGPRLKSSSKCAVLVVDPKRHQSHRLQTTANSSSACGRYWTWLESQDLFSGCRLQSICHHVHNHVSKRDGVWGQGHHQAINAPEKSRQWLWMKRKNQVNLQM